MQQLLHEAALPHKLDLDFKNMKFAIIPQIIGQAVGSIPIPSFDLSSMAGNYLPPGIELGLGNAQTRYDASYLLLEGDLVRIP